MPFDLTDYTASVSDYQSYVTDVQNATMSNLQGDLVVALNQVGQMVQDLAAQVVELAQRPSGASSPGLPIGPAQTPVLPADYAALEQQLFLLKGAAQSYMDQTSPFEGQAISKASVAARERLQDVMDHLED